MNIEKNPKTFNYLFTLFIKMGEKELGRQLTNEELLQIRSSIEKKCANIDKKDIVKEIYKLELARNEAKHGHLSITKKLALANFLSEKLDTPVSLSFSSKTLIKDVSKQFADIELSDKYDNIKLFDTQKFENERSRLIKSYSKDVFNYRAPLGTKDKITRLACLAGVGLVFLSGLLLNHTQKQDMPQFPDDKIVAVDESNTSEQETINLEDTVSDDLLQDFKKRYAAEYNLAHGGNIVSPYNLKVQEIKHTYVYKVKTTDSNGNETYKYMTHANPTETKAYLDSHGYEYTAVYNNISNSISVVSAVNSDKTELYDAYAEIDGKYVPIIDGSSPEKLEENQVTPNILLNMEKCFSEIIRNPARRSAYINFLKDYYRNNPENALDDDIIIEQADNEYER